MALTSMVRAGAAAAGRTARRWRPAPQRAPARDGDETHPWSAWPRQAWSSSRASAPSTATPFPPGTGSVL